MDKFVELISEYCWVFYLLPLVLLAVRFLLIKNESVSKLLAGLPFVFLSIYLFIDIADTPKGIFNQGALLLGLYMASLGFIEYLIDANKKTFARTTFYKQYSQIENHWESIQSEGQSVEKKKEFIINNLSALANSIMDQDVIENGISVDQKEIQYFSEQAGNVNADYLWMCCNKEEFFKKILATLYSDLFLQFKEMVLSGFQISSSGTSSGGNLPEFVSTELTQALLVNPDISYQYNTSVTSIADYAKDNCVQKLKKSGSHIELRRIIITNDVTSKNYTISDLNTICEWHKDNGVSLKFISKNDADSLFVNERYYGQRDFSIIGMDSSNVLLEASNTGNTMTFGGRDHDMYRLDFKADLSAEKAKKMFLKLWHSSTAITPQKNDNNNYSLQ